MRRVRVEQTAEVMLLVLPRMAGGMRDRRGDRGCMAACNHIKARLLLQYSTLLIHDVCWRMDGMA